MQGHSFVANGNIGPCRFVKQDTTTDGRVLQCGSGDQPFGISQKATHLIALSGGGFSTDDGFAATAGLELQVFGQGHMNVYLELGGTVANGDFLKPDANGKGVTAGTDKDKYGARALAAGTSGKLIPVEVVIGDLSI